MDLQAIRRFIIVANFTAISQDGDESISVILFRPVLGPARGLTPLVLLWGCRLLYPVGTLFLVLCCPVTGFVCLLFKHGGGLKSLVGFDLFRCFLIFE